METTTLKLYIGTKMVKAEPMVKSAAVAKGWARPSEGNQDAPGYHVSSTSTQMAAPMIHGRQRTCLSSLIR